MKHAKMLRKIFLMMALASVLLILSESPSLAQNNADLTFSKEDSQDPVTEGDNFTYTLRVENTDKKKDKDVTVEDLLPEEVTFRSVSTDKGSCSTSQENGRTLVTCNVGDLAKEGKDKKPSSATVTIEVTADQQGVISNTANASDDKGAQVQDDEQTTVNDPNQPPTARNDTAATDEDTATTFNVLGNDTDPNNDNLAVTDFTQPQNGSVNCEPGGDCTYEPNQNFNGQDSFTYTISDGNGGTDTARVNVNVRAVNDPPQTESDTATTRKDTPVDVAVLANDSDPDGDDLTITNFTQGDSGSVDCSANGPCTYNPEPDFNGEDTFTYTVSDGNGGTDTNSVTVTVEPVNDDPEARNDAYETDEDQTLTVDAPGVLGNDTDTEDDQLTAERVDGPQNGTLNLNADGSFTYDPNQNFNGQDSFRYRARDGNDGTDTATVNITVNPQNDDPTAQDDTGQTNEDNPVRIDVVANDTDPEGDPLTVDNATRPDNGTTTINDDNTITYDPDPNFNGQDTFTYQINDGNGGTDTATVTVDVAPVDDAPQAQNDRYQTGNNETLTVQAPGVLENDSDPEGDPITAERVSGPQNGTFNLNADGSFSYDPNQNFDGEDSFTYRACDDSGVCSEETTVTISVGPGNDPPTANDDAYETDEDQTLTVDAPGVLQNDEDIDGDQLTAERVDGPKNGTLNLNADGSFTYEPNQNFNGEDSFRYRARDGNGGTDTATVNITVNPQNDAPVAEDDSDTTQEDTPVTTDVVANDADPDDDPLTITNFTQPQNGTIHCENTNGTCTYSPDDNFNGQDSYTYTIGDGNGGTDTATVNITVEAVNDDPVARNDNYETREDETLTAPPAPGVLENDSDPEGDPLTARVIEQTEDGELILNPDGSFRYDPEPNFSGQDSFRYRVSDGQGGTDTATVRIDITPVNDPPTARDDDATTNEDEPVKINVLRDDSDPENDTLVVDSFTQPQNGTTTKNNDGTITYEPDPNFNGQDSFNYTAADGNGGTDTAEVTVTVQPVNDDPTISNIGDRTIPEDTSTDRISFTVGDLETSNENLTVQESSDNQRLVKDNIDITIRGTGADRTVEVTPQDNENGEARITLTVRDADGGMATETFTVTVTPENDAPIAQDNVYETNEDTPLIVDAPGVLNNDTDPDDNSNLTARPQNEPASRPDHGQLTLNDDGSFSYEPNDGYNGTDSFTYVACDETETCSDPALVVIDVSAVNDAPVARNDSARTAENRPARIDVLANDRDPEGGELSIESTTKPDNGRVIRNPDNTLTYRPNRGFSGTDTFRYKISDGNGGTDTARVTVNVNEPAVVNRPPNARDDAARTAKNKSVRVAVLRNDSDPNRDNIRIANFGQPKHGKVYKRSETLIYKPDRNFSGRDAFNYRISDGKGGTDRARVRITVRPAPKPKPRTQVCRPGRDGKTIFGTPGNDVLRGTSGDDRIFGFGGNDRIIGGNGEDQIIGGDGSDIIRGGPCGDTIKANDGNNRVYGEGGDDVMGGGKDRDLISGGKGEDVFMGNGGRDRLIARDGREDVVNGGSGRDSCQTDRRDKKVGCP